MHKDFHLSCILVIRYLYTVITATLALINPFFNQRCNTNNFDLNQEKPDEIISKQALGAKEIPRVKLMIRGFNKRLTMFDDSLISTHTT